MKVCLRLDRIPSSAGIESSRYLSRPAHNPLSCRSPKEFGTKLYENALLYRIGLPSNSATLLALFVRIELLCFGAVFVDLE